MNKVYVTLTTLIIVLLIIVPSVYKIYNDHQEKLIIVTEKRITEAAEKCFRENICNEEKITLKELYENNYLEKESDPITKEYYNEDSYIQIVNDEYKFVIK